MKSLLLLPLLLPLCGCVHTAAIVEQLKGDPATIDISVQTIYGSFMFHRSFPTNWIISTPAIKMLPVPPIPPTPAVKLPTPPTPPLP